jgi:adenylate cyclase
MAEEHARRRLAAILAADVVGYSRLMEQDEAGTLELLKARRRTVLQPIVSQHEGRIFKVTGDGVLVEFASAVNAVRCSIALQSSMAAANGDLPAERKIMLRVGVSLGDVIVEGNDLYGDGVNVAARLEALAEPGGIVVSGTAFDHVKNKIQASFDDLGLQNVKNIAEPVRLYRVTGTTQGRPTPPRAPVDRPSIAVLPFTNMSGDPEQQYFSDGMTEDIITDLSKISGLLVVARNTVFTFKDKPVKVQQAARELGVRFVLEGSVRKSGSRVRITGQLIDGNDGNHIWAERYDRELTDIFLIQDEIRQAIVDQLKVKLLPAERKAIDTPPTGNVEAYTYYLRGRQFSHERTKAYLLLARRMFTKAVELDPHYARAYAGIAICDVGLHSWHSAEISLDAILANSVKALDLDPDLAEAHAARALALQHSQRPAEAIEEFERALALDPDLYEANYFFARFFSDRGDFEKAAALFERAAAIQPEDYLAPISLLAVCRSLGRHGEREKWARLVIERAERALALRPENSGPAHRGALALAHIGERDRAKDWAARALATDPDDMVALYNIACMHSVLGEVDEAIDLLEKVLPHSSAEQMSWYQTDSDLDPVRTHPRYQQLLERVGSAKAPHP